MIDIHMLTLPTDNSKWKEFAISRIPPWATLHVIEGVIGPIGPQRLKAFRLGTHPYVSCIDPDDWTEPNTFDVCLQALEERQLSGVCTKELIHDLINYSETLCPFKHKTFVLRRDWMEAREALFRYDMPESEIIATPEIPQLNFVGHHWRQYNSAGSRQRRLKQT